MCSAAIAKRVRDTKDRQASRFFASSASFAIKNLACLLAAFAFAGCGAPLYNVGPIPKSLPADAATSATAKGLEVSAATIREDDEAFARFGGNLPLAGIVAVDVRVANPTNRSLDPGRLKFELRDAAGKKLKRLDAKQALKRLMKFNRIENYFIESYRRTREAFASRVFPHAVMLVPGAEARGVVFFDAKRDVTKLGPLTLRITGGASPVVLQLN